MLWSHGTPLYGEFRDVFFTVCGGCVLSCVVQCGPQTGSVGTTWEQSLRLASDPPNHSLRLTGPRVVRVRGRVWDVLPAAGYSPARVLWRLLRIYQCL